MSPSPGPPRPASPGRRSGSGAPRRGGFQAAVAVLHMPWPCAPLLRDVSGSYTFDACQQFPGHTLEIRSAVGHDLLAPAGAVGPRAVSPASDAYPSPWSGSELHNVLGSAVCAGGEAGPVELWVRTPT